MLLLDIELLLFLPLVLPGNDVSVFFLRGNVARPFALLRCFCFCCFPGFLSAARPQKQFVLHSNSRFCSACLLRHLGFGLMTLIHGQAKAAPFRTF
jgi:hypothetical protein